MAGNLDLVRNAKLRARGAAESVATSGETVLDTGTVWAAQVQAGKHLLFRGRRQYLVALTDRRLLVFERHAKKRRDPLSTADLAMGKRYEFFTIDRRRRSPTLFQLVLRGDNDTRLVLEFRPSQRSIGRALEQRLTPGDPVPMSASAIDAAASGPPQPGAPQPGANGPGPWTQEDERTTAETFWGSR